MDESTILCSVEDCERPVDCKKLCRGHRRQADDGKPFTPLRSYVNHSMRDEMGRKRCRRCGSWKQTDDFTRNNRSSDRLSIYCKSCELSRTRQRRYGFTAEQYAELLEAQGGGCAICGETNQSGRSLAIDHDHACCPDQNSCGKCVRGLLCDGCNLGIGKLRDNPNLLRKAAIYIEGTR